MSGVDHLWVLYGGVEQKSRRPYASRRRCLQSLGEAGSTYLTRGPLFVVRTRHVTTHSSRSLVTRVSRHMFVACLSRHNVVAPFPAAPLLIDTRRSTVGPGTREDFVTVPPVLVLSYAATASLVVYIALAAVGVRDASSRSFMRCISGRLGIANAGPVDALRDGSSSDSIRASQVTIAATISQEVLPLP